MQIPFILFSKYISMTQGEQTSLTSGGRDGPGSPVLVVRVVRVSLAAPLALGELPHVLRHLPPSHLHSRTHRQPAFIPTIDRFISMIRIASSVCVYLDVFCAS